MANYRVNNSRFTKKFAIRAFSLLEKGRLDFGLANAPGVSISELDAEQLTAWSAELARRLEHLAGYLALCVLHGHEDYKVAGELLAAVSKLVRSYRGGTI